MEETATLRTTVAAALLAAGLTLGSRARSVERAVTLYLLYAAVPVITFYKVASTPLGVVGAYAALVAASMGTALGSAAALLPRLLCGYPRGTVAAAVLAAGIHNAGFLPIPLMLILYGDAGPAALYSALANIYMSLAIPLVLSRFSDAGGGLASIARGVAGYPPFYGLVAGAALRLLGPGLPPQLHTVYTFSAESTIVSFFLVGSTLRRAGLGLDRVVALVAAWRLVVEPVSAALAAYALGLRGMWLAGALLESFMPPATMNLVVALAYGLDYKVVARSIGLVTPVSVALAAVLRAAGVGMGG